MIDTLRADHMGVYGYSRDTTPNIDRWARDATVFDQAYSHAPWTVPSIASILTSLTPIEHGIVGWRQPLPRSLLTLAEHLQVNGYHTEAVVSHVIFRSRYNFDQGFAMYDTSVLEKGKPKEISTAREVTDLGIAALRRTRKSRSPFFVWLHYFDPHSQYLRHATHDFGDRDIDRYDSEIAFTDEQIGRLLEELDESGLKRDTIVALIADHGEEFLDHGGLRHTKTLYDEVIRVPLILWGPNLLPQRIEEVVPAIDLAPTLCRLADVPIPVDFRGHAFSIAGNQLRVEIETPVISETLREADKRSVRHQRWKWIHDREAGSFELYDLENDPRESKNLVTAFPTVAEALQELVDHHYARARRPVATEQLPPGLQMQLESLGYLDDS